MKKWIINFVVINCLFFFFLTIRGKYDQHHISDAFFISGALVLFYGLIFVTNAFQFISFTGYSFKRLFSRKEKRDKMAKSYFDYLQDLKQLAKENPFSAFPMIMLGGAYCIISLIIALNI